MDHPLYNILRDAVKAEITQMAEEGHDREEIQKEFNAAEATGSLDALAILQSSLWKRPSPESFRYTEPSDWETISDGFPKSIQESDGKLSEETLGNKILGGWLGRCAGCQLGKPIEGLPYERIRAAMLSAGAWPMTDYMPELDEKAFKLCHPEGKENLRLWMNTLSRGKFDHVAPDDDIHYAITSLLVLERHGTDFTAQQAVDTIADASPISTVFASGRNAVTTRIFGFTPPFTALFANSFRQSLGAQIRCDPWGWAAPGRADLAARMAFNDASCSQTRNGIYSGIFFSVLLADSIVTGNAVASIETARKFVPPGSRFAEMIKFVISACGEKEDWEDVCRGIYAQYGNHADGTPVPLNHSLINAAMVVMALIKGEGDFSTTLGISAMAGMDTDCNAATTGSIMGVALGAKAIPSYWTDSFNNTIRTDLKAMGQLAISGLAERTFAIARRAL